MNPFSPNVSLLWQHLPVADRFIAAQDCGFQGVEFWPWEDHEMVRQAVARTGLTVSVLNVHPGPQGLLHG